MTAAIDIDHRSRDRFAQLVALLTHPVVIGTAGLLTVIMTSMSGLWERLFYLLILVLITFMPAALYLFVFFRGNISEMLELIDREARLVPYVLMILGAVTAVIFLTWLQAPRAVYIVTLVLLANEVILGTINFWTKVSIHTATATFTGLTMGYLIHPHWFSLLFLLPLIGWARVYRKRHSASQVVTGAIFAALITILVIILSTLYLP